MKTVVNKTLTVLSAAAVILSSCTKLENEKGEPKHIGTEVTATFEQPVFNDVTKALDNMFHFSFESNEQINIYPQLLGQCMVCV